MLYHTMELSAISSRKFGPFNSTVGSRQWTAKQQINVSCVTFFVMKIELGVSTPLSNSLFLDTAKPFSWTRTCRSFNKIYPHFLFQGFLIFDECIRTKSGRNDAVCAQFIQVLHPFHWRPIYSQADIYNYRADSRTKAASIYIHSTQHIKSRRLLYNSDELSLKGGITSGFLLVSTCVQ